jgi:multidrug efflux pump subunit AcrB
MAIAQWSVRNRVAANLLAIVLLVSGFLAAGTRLKLDLFPDVSTNFISVTVLDPTTSVAEEIERTITAPIEEELTNVRGVEKIRSTSEDNFSNIFIQVESSITDIDPVLNEVRQAVDKAKPKLPTSIEPPVIDSFDVPFPLITFTVSYDAAFDPMQIRLQLDRLQRELKIIPGVSEVLVDGLDRREVWIEVDPFRLQSLGVSFEEVSNAVSRKNLNLVGGRMDATGGQRMVRVLGEITDAEGLAEVPIKTIDGRVVLLRDVATFKDRSEEERTMGRANMRPAVTFTVVKKKGSDAIQTVQKCREVFISGTADLPPGVETQILSDTTRFIKVRINTVVQNGVQALLLVTILLMLFLNWRLALVVAVGIPISFAGTFLVLYLGGYTINLLSLFAMIMALGMVVDDAIVISENAYRYIQQGMSPAKAAVQGAQEVFWPVVGSVSTTVAAFLPLIWGEGIIGKFLVIVPVVVISTLFFSLVQAFLVLPSHIADFVRRSPSAREIEATAPAGLWSRITRVVSLSYAEMQETMDGLLSRVIEVYTHLLLLALRLRYLAIGIFLTILIGLGAALGAGLVPFKLFSTDFADILIIKTELPPDFSLQQSAEVVARLEKRLSEELPGDDIIAIITRIGARLDATDQFLEYGTNLSMLTIDLDEENPRARKPSVIERDIRKILLEFPEFISATAKREEGGPPVGRAVNVEVQGPDFADLKAIADRIEGRLREVRGTVNVGNDLPAGKTEFRIVVDESRAARAGLDVASIGRALQAGYRGLEAARMRWGNEEVILRVKVAEQYAQDPEMLMAYRIINREGQPVDLSSVAEIERTSGISRIRRINSERVLTVSADVDDRITTSAAVNTQIREWIPGILADHPGYHVQLTGENEDTEKSLAAMKFASVVALLLIYALLAVITNSFLQPVIIMSVIPFGIVGVILGLIIMGVPMGLMSLMGTIALAGIVVNNSVVFVDFINATRHTATHDPDEHSRHQPLLLNGFTRWRSIVTSGRVRFRPVFLTTATTVAGLSNLAFVSSGQEQFLAPMAQAIIFGLSFASLITMILIPCLYSVLDDLHRVYARLTGAH